MDRIFRVTTYQCTACGKCELACAFAHGVDGKPARSRIYIQRQAPDAGIPIVCLQCDSAACAVVCPTQALTRNDNTGAIELLHERCIACRLCIGACPFGNMVWDEAYGVVQKCDLCGGDPRCVPFCPSSALEYVAAGSAVKHTGADDKISR